MILEYLSGHWVVQAIAIVAVTVICVIAMINRNYDRSEERNMQREREKRMLVEHKDK